MDKEDLIDFKIEKSVAYIRLCHAERANAYTNSMLEELGHGLLAALAKGGVRVIVIQGTEGYFCAGADFEEIKGRKSLDALDLLSAKIFNTIADSPIPVIAAIDGPAIGGGLELALACDLRIATSRSIFAFPETALGIIPAAGGTWRLPRIVGESTAKQIILFGTELSARKALSKNLVDRVVEPENLDIEVAYWVEAVKDKDPQAIRLAKKAIETSLSGGDGPGFSAMAQGVLYDIKNRRQSKDK